MIASPIKKSYNAPARTHSYIIYPHNTLPSLDMLADWVNLPRHTWLFDVMSTQHITQSTSRSFIASSNQNQIK